MPQSTPRREAKQKTSEDRSELAKEVAKELAPGDFAKQMILALRQQATLVFSEMATPENSGATNSSVKETRRDIKVQHSE